MLATKSVLKPTLLFAAGAVAGTAHAATIQNVDLTASYARTPVSILGAQQYSFGLIDKSANGDPTAPNTKTKAQLSGNTGNFVYDRQDSAYFPTAKAAGSTNIPATTAKSDGSTGGNGYYGLTFTNAGTAYTGYALVDSGTPPPGTFFTPGPDGQVAGLHISQIGYQVAAAPEPADWALGIVGFGGVGMALRSRRRAQRAALANA